MKLLPAALKRSFRVRRVRSAGALVRPSRFLTLGRVPTVQRANPLLLSLLICQGIRVRPEYEWPQRGPLFHMKLPVASGADTVVTAGELATHGLALGAIATGTLWIPLRTAFATADQ